MAGGDALDAHHEGSQPWFDADLSRIIDRYSQHQRRVYRLCLAYLHDPAAAEDAVQETFIRAVPRLAATEERGAGSLLLLVARSICIDELRHRSAEGAAQRRLGWLERPLDPAVSAEDSLLAHAVWERLDERERVLFVYRFAGYSYEEISARLRMSASAVSMALTRARRHARRLVSGLGGVLLAPLARWRRRRGYRLPSSHTVGALWRLRRWGGRLLLLLTTAGIGTGLGFAATRAPEATPSSNVTGVVLGGGGGQPVVTDIAMSAGFARDRIMVASGRAAGGCRVALCPVLQISHDGGSSWAPLPAAGFAGGRILLPPAFPHDPTIYAAGVVGLQKSADGGRSFRTILGIPGPAAMVPAESGEGVRIVIGGTPLWVYDGASRRLGVGPAMPPGMIGVDDVRVTGAGALLLVGTRVDAAAPQMRDRVAVRCEARSCRQVLAVHDEVPLRLAAAPPSATAVAVYSPTSLFVSADEGRSFTAVRTTSGDVAAAAMRLVGSSWHVVALLAAADGNPTSLLVLDAEGRLRTVVPAVSMPRQVTWMAALPDGRLITGLADTDPAGWNGLRCSSDGGARWEMC